MDNFSASSKADGRTQNDLSQNALEAESNLAEEMDRHEREATAFKKANIEYLYKYSSTLQKEATKLAKKDAEAINEERQSLERKYQSLYEKNLLDKKQKERLIALGTAQYAKTLNVENSKAALKQLADVSKLEKKNNKQKLKDLKKDKSEEGKLILTEYKKTLNKQKEDDKKVKIKNREAIMESAVSKKEGYKERLEADPTDNAAAFGLWGQEKLDDLKGIFTGMVDVSKTIVQTFQQSIEDYSSYQSKVNARLQGSGQTWNNGGVGETLMEAVGSNPYVKLADLLENASKAVEAGIAYNVEQRAFLETVKDDIATTFDAFNSNLLRIVRLQQSDSTAARLGLEADLTQLFNSYFSDTSYLSDAFDTVSANLTEAIAQMGTEEGVAFEYQVQKWLGSLYSVGFSDSVIGNIATALGQLGSGDVSGLASNSQMQNLIVMAASRVGLSYADMLTEGLDAETTNTLLASMVEYLQEIATSDNKVVKSQYSQIFGLTSADLVAAKNLGITALDIANESLNYAGAVNELYNQMNQLPSRLSMGEMTGNMIDNVKYAIGAGIADNPVTYALWEMTDMIEGLSGGLQLPKISVMGNSFDIGTSITNLMRLGVVGAGALENIGTIVSGLGNIASPSSMLSKLGITTQTNQITRGGGLNRNQRVTQQVSQSNMIGNSAGEDYEASVTAQAEAEGDAAIDAKKEEEQTKSINDIHEYLLQVFDPKITSMTQMLAVISGTKLTDTSGWKIFEDQEGLQYSATTLKIETLGDAKKEEEQIKYINEIHDYLLQVFDSKITAITRMLASVSGTKLTDVKGNDIFEDKNSNQYTATTVSIVSLGESNNTPQLVSNIDKNVSSILAIMQSPLNVNVLSYPILRGLNGQLDTGSSDTGGAGL